MSKKNKSSFENIKNLIYALKTISSASPLAIPMMILTQTAYWFFANFVQQILFLRVLLGIIEKKGTYKEYMIMVVVFVVSGLIAKAIEMFSDYQITLCYRKIYHSLNKKIFSQAGRVDIECFENPRFFDVYTRATEIVSNKRYVDFCFNIARFASSMITGIFLIVYIVSIDPRLLLIMSMLVLVFFILGYKNKLEIKKDKEMTPNTREKSYVQRTVFLRDFSKDMRTSDIFSVMYRKMKRAVENNREIIRKYGVRVALADFFVSTLSESFPVAATYLYTCYRFVVKKDLQVSDFSVVMTAISNLNSVINECISCASQIQKISLYFGYLREFFNFKAVVTGGEMQAEEFESIEFRNVSFKYPASDTYSLENVSLKITKEDRVAIVGHNGAGKTTFVKLLLRFYDPTDGEILYNGINILDYNINSLRKRLATVFQNYKVYALSVDENVLCREVESEEDASLSEKSLKKSGVSDKVSKLPMKGSTVITREFDDKGTGLSGGEQQKVAAARMFAKNYDLAILDEPSSALDPIAEYKMYESIIAETEKKSVIFISHRLSSATLSDKIFVFGNGTVLESGTHDELIKKGGVYAEMFSMQASNYSEEVSVT